MLPVQKRNREGKKKWKKMEKNGKKWEKMETKQKWKQKQKQNVNRNDSHQRHEAFTFHGHTWARRSLSAQKPYPIR